MIAKIALTYELLRVLPPGASAAGEAVDRAMIALGLPRATGAVRAHKTCTQDLHASGPPGCHPASRSGSELAERARRQPHCRKSRPRRRLALSQMHSVSRLEGMNEIAPRGRPSRKALAVLNPDRLVINGKA